jgi:hypothetical protein
MHETSEPLLEDIPGFLNARKQRQSVEPDPPEHDTVSLLDALGRKLRAEMWSFVCSCRAEVPRRTSTSWGADTGRAIGGRDAILPPSLSCVLSLLLLPSVCSRSQLERAPRHTPLHDLAVYVHGCTCIQRMWSLLPGEFTDTVIMLILGL